MPDLATLVFLCNCLRSSPCMLGFANGVGLGLECMYLHTAVECVLFVAEIDSHDNYLIEMEGCALTVDMSLRLKDGCSRTCGNQRVRFSQLQANAFALPQK